MSGVMHLHIDVQQVAELDDAEDQRQQQRQHERELDDTLSAETSGKMDDRRHMLPYPTVADNAARLQQPIRSEDDDDVDRHTIQVRYA
jgi:hypothetical protein